ncbi:MAG: cupin domain-containing protein [Asticcacaulis sp.]|nr:cupin domain-containing protein [Asticcacaulis sp.]
MTADDVIASLGLQPHPEGGHYAETFRDTRLINGRPASSAIYYLLQQGEVSHWHRIDAVEVWHWYAGAALHLAIHDRGVTEIVHLGPDLAAGQRPQALVPTGAWQGAESMGEWSLVGCTVAPAFQFSGFEMAPKGWSP